MKGEVGCAIDSDQGIVTVKIGDGVHQWKELEVRMGTKEEQLQTAQSSMSNALQKIATAAKSYGVSLSEMMESIRNLSATGANCELLLENINESEKLKCIDRRQFKTLNYKHEVE